MYKIILSAGLLVGCLPIHAQRVLTLEQCRVAALSHNIQMRTAQSHVDQARQTKEQALTNYFPTVTASGAAFYSNKDIIKGKVNTADILPADVAGNLPTELASSLPSTMEIGLLNKGVVAGVTAMQPVFMGGQIVNGNRLAKLEVEAATLQQKTSANHVEITAEQYYWQVVTLKEKLRTLDAVSKVLQQVEHDVHAAVDAGMKLRNDLLQVQLRENNVENQRIKLTNALNLSRLVLAQYIGMDRQQIDAADTAIVDQGMPVFPLALKTDHDKAVPLTAEYQLLENRLQLAICRLVLSRANFCPALVWEPAITMGI